MQAEQKTRKTAEFTGKRVLVTGGTKGIGAAIVKRLAAGGATVLTTARSIPTGSAGQVVQADVSTHEGCDRVINAWGGYSKATTRALEDLHHRGLLRIARRENGIRVYEATVSSARLVVPIGSDAPTAMS